MTKIRLSILILISMFIVFIFPLQLLDLLEGYLFLIIGAILFLIYYYVKRWEKQKVIAISKIYLQECDPERYIFEFEIFLKKTIRNKKVKYLNQITIALAQLAAGSLEESKRILDSLVPLEPEFDLVIRFWYYKAWIYYFEETQELGRIHTLIQQSKLLIDESPLKYRAQLVSNLNQIRARYYVATNIHLDLAEQEFSLIYKVNLPRLNVVNNVYYLGIISYQKKNYEKALEYFRSVKKNGNKLNIVDKASKYIEKIEADYCVSKN